MKFSIGGVQVNLIETPQVGKKYDMECDSSTFLSDTQKYSNGKVLIIILDNKGLKKIIKFIKKFLDDKDLKKSNYKELKSIHLLVKDENEALETLKKKFKSVNAGGGAIFKREKLLFIFRLGKWDLPKGKMNKGEHFEETAKREVEEETGVKVEIVKLLTTSFHTYMRNKKYYLKETKWYKMKCLDDRYLAPQEEEGIVDVEWVSPEYWDEKLINSYKTIKKVINVIRKNILIS